MQNLKIIIYVVGIFVSVLFCEVVSARSQDLVFEIESDNLGGEELSQLAKRLGVMRGKVLLENELNSRLKEVFKERVYEDLKLYVIETNRGLRVKLFATKDKKIKMVDLTQVDKEIADEVKTKIQVDSIQTWDRGKINILKEALKEALQNRGYYNGVVNLNFEPGNEKAIFSIQKNAPALIDKISISSGDKLIDKRLIDELTLKREQIYSKKSVEESIEKVNQYLEANQFATARVEDWSIALSEGNKKVSISFVIRLGEKYQFQFFGNKVFDEYELRSFISEESLSKININQQVVDLLEKKYQASGYHFVSVKAQSSLRKESDKRAITVYRFDLIEGEKVIVDKIHFSGGLSEKTEGELSSLFLENATGVLKRGVFWEMGLPEAIRGFQAALESMGFLSATVSSPRLAFSNDNKGVQLFIDIELGSKTLIQEIKIQGNHFFSDEKILSLLEIKKSESLDQQGFKKRRGELLKAYRIEGFTDVRYEESVKESEGMSLSKDLKTAELFIPIIEGQRYFLGKTLVEGNQKTESRVILREMKVKEGDVFNPELVSQSEEDISALGLFSRVEIISTQSNTQENAKDLKVLVKENKPGVGELGLGGFYEDPRFRLRTFLGVTYRNLFGENQTGTSRVEVSVPFSRQKSFIPFLEYSGALGYRAPYPLQLPLNFISQLTFDSFEVKNIDSEITIQSRTKIEGRVEKKFGKSVTGIYRIYQLERTKLEILEKAGSENVDVIGSTGPGLIVDFRDDIYNPTKGSLHSLNVEFASPLLLSQDEISFVMSIFRNSFYFPLVGGMGLTLFAGAGYAESLFPGRPIPATRLTNDLSLGGRGSIRGFSVRRFSPILDPSSPAVEKTAFYNGRAEVNIPLFSNISGALFFDTGEIFPNLNPDKRHDGVGLGIRYKTPIGPIVIDFAQGLGEDREQLKFYFTVGTL